MVKAYLSSADNLNTLKKKKKHTNSQRNKTCSSLDEFAVFKN